MKIGLIGNKTFPINERTQRPLARIPLLPALDPSRDTSDSGNPLLDEAVTLASQSARNAAGLGGTGALTWQAYAARARTRATIHDVRVSLPDIDWLVLEDRLLDKKKQPPWKEDDWRSSIPRD